MKRIYALLIGIIWFNFGAYSQQVERYDTIQRTVVISKDNLVTISHVGAPASWSDYTQLFDNYSLDPYVIKKMQTSAFIQATKNSYKEKIKTAIKSAISQDKLKGIKRINIRVVLSLSGHIELVTVLPSKAMIERWEPIDYYNLDQVLKSDIFYATWSEKIPYLFFNDSIQITE